MRYRDAGVNVHRGDAIKQAIARAVESTWTGEVRPIRGGFAGVMKWPAASPLVAATMDGVGTKLHLAMAANRLGDAAADLVYHGANDLLVHGAAPLAFLDYIAQARLDAEATLAAVLGLARACREVGAALLGGETAEMPDTYLPNVIDVAGCMIGRLDERRLLDGSAVRPGDRLIGLAASGLHTNGYSLARRVLEVSKLALDDPLPGGRGESVADALLAPHRWYGPAVDQALAAGGVHALAHVTGGGIAGNLVRVLPEGCSARVRAGAWPIPAVFRWLMSAGAVPEEDARTTFNLGIGFIAVVDAGNAEAVRSALARTLEAWEIGEIAAGQRGVEWMQSP
jgi:phosphoribosylformylglycinamidine cyclo-ligase